MFPNQFGNRGWQQPQMQPQSQFEQFNRAIPANLYGRVVTNVEEAKAIPLEYFDGTALYLPSPAEAKIYVKYINNMGLPSFDVYERIVDKTPTLENRIQRLEGILKELGYDDKSNAINTTNAQQ